MCFWPQELPYVQAELVPTARELGIGFLAYSPLVPYLLSKGLLQKLYAGNFLKPSQFSP